jgi:hypothetical protein
VRRRHVQLLLSAILALAPGCGTKRGGQTSQPVTAEPVRTEPAVFVEAPPDPAPPPSSERPPVTEPSDAQREAAKQLFQDGVQAYEAGDLVTAVEKFREAYLLAPLPAMLFNIARAQEQLGDTIGACESYRAAHADPEADDDMRRLASDRMTQLSCP